MWAILMLKHQDHHFQNQSCKETRDGETHSIETLL